MDPKEVTMMEHDIRKTTIAIKRLLETTTDSRHA
jgi:hypothetical protein